MSRRHVFLRSLVFALCAGIAAVLLRVTLGTPLSQWSLAVFAVPAYLLVIAPTTRRGVGVAAAAGCVLCLMALVVLDSVPFVALLVLGVGRSAVLYATKPLRALLVEVPLFVLGCALGVALAGSHPFSDAMVVWGFFLVQAAYPLVARAAPAEDAPAADPFDRATSNAHALLDDLAR